MSHGHRRPLRPSRPAGRRARGTLGQSLPPAPRRPAPLRADEHDRPGQGRRRPARSARAAPGGRHSAKSTTRSDRGQPGPPALHRRLAGDAAAALEVVGLCRPPSGRPNARRRNDDVVDAELGQLLHRPLGPVPLGQAPTDGHGRRPAGGRPRPRPRPRPRAPNRAGRQRAGAVGHHDVAGAQAQHLRSGGDRRRPARDARASATNTSGPGAGTGLRATGRHLKAARMRQTRPPLGGGHGSPRSSASRRRAPPPRRSRSVGVSTHDVRCSRSPRPRPPDVGHAPAPEAERRRRSGCPAGCRGPRRRRASRTPPGCPGWPAARGRRTWRPGRRRRG